MNKPSWNTAGSCVVSWTQRILEKGFIISYNQVCLKFSNISVRYKIYRDTWYINFNFLILQESLTYNFVSTSGSWGLGWFKDNPQVQDYIYFSTKWGFIILNLVCTKTHRKLGLHCHRFVFPKIIKKKLLFSLCKYGIDAFFASSCTCTVSFNSYFQEKDVTCWLVCIKNNNLESSPFCFFFNIAGCVCNQLVSKYQLLVIKPPFSQF